MNRGERRKRRVRKINQRINKIKKISNDGLWVSKYINTPGLFSNNNIMNKLITCGTAKKTKSKHGHQTYRHHGTYGKAINYCFHDLKQVQNMNYQEDEFFGRV